MAECSPGQFQFLLTGPPERAAMPGLALNHSSWQADTPGAGKARVVPSHSHPSGHPLIPILRTPQDFLTLAVTFPNNKLDTPDEVPRSSRSSSHHPWCFLAAAGFCVILGETSSAPSSQLLQLQEASPAAPREADQGAGTPTFRGAPRCSRNHPH